MGRSRRLSAEPFELDITGLNADGSGAARHDESTLRVWGALGGETVRARYLFGRRFRGQAETLEVLTASPGRVPPRCPNFGTCSACTLQHLDVQSQLEFKQAGLLQLFSAAGGMRPRRVLPPLAARPWHSRRKARLSVRDVPAKGRVLVGFRERDGRFITDMQECHSIDQRLAQLLPHLSALIGTLEARATVPQLEAACGDDAIALVVRHLEPLSDRDLHTLQMFEQQHALRLYLQPKGPDSVTPLSAHGPQLTYALPAHGLTLSFEPLDFIQVNAELNLLMIDQALELMHVQPGQQVLDLFCGIGNFSLPLARAGAQVTGIEGSAGLVARAGRNARDNGVHTARFIHADLYAEQVALPQAGAPFDSILLDPPRSGAGPLLAQLAASGARRIVYISCNPKTLVADASVLAQQHGFELAAAGLMDMFPHTPHSEAMAVFERGNGS